jgi:hypothetical protein
MKAPMAETEAADADLILEVSADDDAEIRAQTSKALMAHPMMRQEFQAGDLWLVRFDLSDKDDEPDRFSALVQDTASGRTLEAEGIVGEPSSIVIMPMSQQRAPTDEEFTWAVAAVAADEDLAGVMADTGTSTYRPAPALANVTTPDGAIDRVITVGIRSEQDQPRHRVVGVRTSDGVVVAEPFGRPLVADDECGAAPEVECPPLSGSPRARVRLARGDVALWELVVVRPSASSGTNGSGVELRRVEYKGQRVMARAHVPIATVRSTSSAAGCGPTHRSWLHEESCFAASGDDPVPGFRVCSAAPSTILDRGEAGGDFRGVAFWLDGDDLLIVSQIQAGWYRYVSEWRLLADGTIQPRLGVVPTRNPCTCGTETHHAYWRFDFDILGADNNLVQEHNRTPVSGTSPWHTTRYEVRRPRDAAADRFWRVRNVSSSQGYSLIPGGDDGEADHFGVGDLWVLRQYDDEFDDGRGATSDPMLSRADLDRFVNGEPVERQDVVLWYAGHLRQGPSGPSERGSQDPSGPSERGTEGTDGPDEPGRRIGPDLVPSNWRDLPTSTERFEPPVPPPLRT